MCSWHLFNDQSLIIIQSCFCFRHDFMYIRGWMQMVLAPNDLFSWNKNTVRQGLTGSTLHTLGYLFYNARQHSLCAWLSPEVLAGPSPVSLAMLLCLPSSTVRNQLLLFTLPWRAGALYPQNGVPFPRIHAHSLPMVQNSFQIGLDLWTKRLVLGAVTAKNKNKVFKPGVIQAFRVCKKCNPFRWESRSL
jgi:hypothetical protein